MQARSLQLWRTKLYDMKRDWLSFIAEADARGDQEEATLYRSQLNRITEMLEELGADPSLDPPRRTQA